MEEQINIWFKKNTKLHKRADLKMLNEYIIKHIIKTKKINISNDYMFEFIDKQFDNIRPENIFKLNWLHICKKLDSYFPQIKIKCMFEKASDVDKEIQKGNAVFRHDVYICICNPLNNKKYDCALEYFEKNSHTKRSIDTDKELYTQQVVDEYIVYEEKSYDLDTYFLNTIHKIMLLICASLNDKYTLAKINFFKKFKSNPKELKALTNNFNTILKYKKDNIFNFSIFYENLQPLNPDTEEEFEFDEFIDFLKNYDIYVNLDKKGNAKYNIFARIILKLDSNISDYLTSYKDIYSETMDIIMDSSDQIIEYINKSNTKKENLPEFLDMFLRNHLQNYKKKFTLKTAYANLKSVKSITN